LGLGWGLGAWAWARARARVRVGVGVGVRVGVGVGVRVGVGGLLGVGRVSVEKGVELREVQRGRLTARQRRLVRGRLDLVRG
jgi:hypothetical protein